LEAQTYDEAAVACRAISGKGISKQAFAILPKIREVDRLITPERQRIFVEMHPEVSFTILAGRPMDHHKSTPEGLAERMVVLRQVFSDIDAHTAMKRKGAQPDDVLDAFVAAWSARRWITRSHRQLGGEMDECGIRMEMIA
jgi:predicted RNase H-like nuclease